MTSRFRLPFSRRKLKQQRDAQTAKDLRSDLIVEQDPYQRQLDEFKGLMEDVENRFSSSLERYQNRLREVTELYSSAQLASSLKAKFNEAQEERAAILSRDEEAWERAVEAWLEAIKHHLEKMHESRASQCDEAKGRLLDLLKQLDEDSTEAQNERELIFSELMRQSEEGRIERRSTDSNLPESHSESISTSISGPETTLVSGPGPIIQDVASKHERATKGPSVQRRQTTSSLTTISPSLLSSDRSIEFREQFATTVNTKSVPAALDPTPTSAIPTAPSAPPADLHAIDIQTWMQQSFDGYLLLQGRRFESMIEHYTSLFSSLAFREISLAVRPWADSQFAHSEETHEQKLQDLLGNLENQVHLLQHEKAQFIAQLQNKHENDLESKLRRAKLRQVKRFTLAKREWISYSTKAKPLPTPQNGMSMSTRGGGFRSMAALRRELAMVGFGGDRPDTFSLQTLFKRFPVEGQLIPSLPTAPAREVSQSESISRKQTSESASGEVVFAFTSEYHFNQDQVTRLERLEAQQREHESKFEIALSAFMATLASAEADVQAAFSQDESNRHSEFDKARARPHGQLHSTLKALQKWVLDRDDEQLAQIVTWEESIWERFEKDYREQEEKHDAAFTELCFTSST